MNMYEKALKKIEEDKKCKPNYYIVYSNTSIGPTGPKGPKGDTGDSVTLEIGSVETTDYQNMASVTDSGSGNNHILNFLIPRGNPGLDGAIGPQGPKGDQGPVGPPGKQIDGITIFGGLYDETPNLVVAKVKTPTIIPIDNRLPYFGIYYGTNTITTNISGIYEVNYRALLSTTLDDSVTISVVANNINIPGTITTVDLKFGNTLQVSGSCFYTVNTLTSFSLAILSGKKENLNVNINNIILTIKKLSDIK